MAKDGKKHYRLIQSYGLFWDRREVDWEGRPAKLLGIATIKEGEVDFGGQRGIYALYDGEFRLLYVGQAGGGDRSTLLTRLKLHNTVRTGTRALAHRWRYFSWFGVLRVLKVKKELADPRGTQKTARPAVLDALEAVAIEIADPDLNRQGGRLGGVTEYLQVSLPDKAKEEP